MHHKKTDYTLPWRAVLKKLKKSQERMLISILIISSTDLHLFTLNIFFITVLLFSNFCPLLNPYTVIPGIFS